MIGVLSITFLLILIILVFGPHINRIRTKPRIRLLIRKAKMKGPQKPRIGRSIAIVGELTRKDAFRIVRELDWAEHQSSFDEIRIFLISIGGAIFFSHVICQAMDQCTKPIEIRSHEAQSAAALILANGTRGRRYVYEGFQGMIHTAVGSNSLMKKWDGPREKLFIRMDTELLSKKTGQSLEKILTDTKNETWFTAEEAVKYGLADGVLALEELDDYLYE